MSEFTAKSCPVNERCDLGNFFKLFFFFPLKVGMLETLKVVWQLFAVRLHVDVYAGFVST